MGYRKELGFDVAEVCGATEKDFEEMVNRGAKFVVIRSSLGKYTKDTMFEHYCALADDYGLEKMAYHYSYARTADDAILEARNCLDVIHKAGVGLSTIWYDLEEYPEPSTEKARAFIKELDLNCGVYASYSFIQDFIDWRSLGCPIWSAQYSSNDDFGGYMWQYAGNIKIVDGLVDLNYRYIPE